MIAEMDCDDDSSSEMQFDEGSSSEMEFEEDAEHFDVNDSNVHFVVRPFDDAEWLFMSIFNGNPGYAMEQFFNFGSQGLQDRLVAEEDSFNEIVGELTGVKPKDINPICTWIREHSAMHDHVEKFCDEATREGVDAMIKQRRDGFLQNHIFSRVFPEANKYVNGVAGSDNFEAIRASSATISTLLRVTDPGEMMMTTTTTAASTGDDDNNDDDDDGTTNNNEAI